MRKHDFCFARFVFGICFAVALSGCFVQVKDLFSSQNKTVLRLTTLHYRHKNDPSPKRLPLSRAVQQRYQTTEALRFEFTANKQGFLYVLHRDPKGQFHALYPATEGNEADSRINAYETFRFPKKAKFVFRPPTGDEHLSFVFASSSLSLEDARAYADRWMPYLPRHTAILTEPTSPRCPAEYMYFSNCQILFNKKLNKTLVLTPDQERDYQVTSESDFFSLPQNIPENEYLSYTSVSFRLSHEPIRQ
ncbi:DUF4384 domain-containing protein [Myxococcota bacterium]|nr:DUF4384 domain-containing protein [Myxococcota bacterium]